MSHEAYTQFMALSHDQLALGNSKTTVATVSQLITVCLQVNTAVHVSTHIAAVCFFFHIRQTYTCMVSRIRTHSISVSQTGLLVMKD